ncbi:pyridoxamine 5'-phosphate oxidase family protein [Microlunatus elymi]|nr:pyridoxamine 5'-phosphate oxidase family protein [Microlunatus elymi]
MITIDSQRASWQEFSEIVARLNYLVLATADDDGLPWASPVFFRMNEIGDVFWVSAPGSRHSSNIAARDAVAATVFDSTAPVGAASAAYLVGHASLVHHAGIAEGLGTLNRGLPEPNQLDELEVTGAGKLRIFRMRVTDRWILVRGSDPRTETEVDARIPVEPPH